MTSLYLSLRSGKAVPTRTEKGKDIERVYYLGMRACLDSEADRFDAVCSFAPDRMKSPELGGFGTTRMIQAVDLLHDHWYPRRWLLANR